jgi:hypothetical protein
MIFDIAIACVSGGGLMVAFAFVANFIGIQGQIKQGVEQMTAVAKGNAEKAQQTGDQGLAATQVQAATDVIKQYLDGLAGLADKLSKLTPSVAALVVSTVLFGLGAALAAIEYLHKAH